MIYRFSSQLDGVKLRDFYDDDPMLASPVFEAFILEMATAVPSLDRLYQEGLAEEYKRLLHKIKPGFLYVGLTSLYEQLNQLEEACGKISLLSEVATEVKLLRRKMDIELPWVENELVKMKALVLT